ncbi:MAG: hypothetical protein IPO87_15270 [Flavobacteriales bacterium]|nr:hypothetical protein [Flavobacteriales bacterium]
MKNLSVSFASFNGVLENELDAEEVHSDRSLSTLPVIFNIERTDRSL